GGVFTAGALLEWLSRDLGLAADPAALAGLGAQVEDSGGVRVLPALAGLGAPWWRPSARAVIAGLTAGTRPGHVARAALDAIAWARMWSGPRWCWRISTTAGAGSFFRSSPTRRPCCAFERVSTAWGWGMRAIRSLTWPWTSVIALTSRGERAASAMEMWKRTS